MHTRRMVLSVVALCALFVSVWMLPDAVASEGAREPARPLAEMTLSASRIDWLPVGDSDHLVLTVAGPEGLWLSKEFEAGQPAFLSLSDLKEERLPDGSYTWELRVVSPSGKLPERSRVESGHFFVKDGSFVPARKKTPAAPPRPPRLLTDESSINDSLAVIGNACIGTSCTSTSYEYSTLTLKATQPNILFDDEFAEGGSTPHDWALFINPSSAAEFSIADFENGLIPFTIAGGAPNSSLYVSGNGNVGLGTATPGTRLHLYGSSTSDAAIGTGPDPVAGPAFNFGYAGATFGRGVGFLNVRPDASATAPNPSLRFMTANVERMIVTNTGNVGIGTSTPVDKLNLFNSADVPTVLRVESTSSGANAVGNFRAQSNTTVVHFRAHGSGRTISHFGVVLGGWSEIVQDIGNGLLIGTQNNTPVILGTNNTNRLQIDGSTGAVTVSGNLTVTGTKNFAVVDPADSRQAIYYTALEGPEAGTYFRGTARTAKGEAVIELPDYFARLTEPERLTVQLTPLGTWGQLYVAEKTPSRLVVRIAPGSTDLEFDYFVQGVRKGYLDYQVQRPNTLPK